MSAVKKHINKILAAFLCACLVISYNPAFGAVEAAFADNDAARIVGSTNDGDGHLNGNGSSKDELNDQMADSKNQKEYTFNVDPNGDGNDEWNAETIVKVSTFDSNLETACRSVFSATIAELKAGSANGNDISYIWYEVTGGTPSQSANPYNATWQVFANGELSPQLTNWVNGNGTTSVEVTTEDNVTSYKIQMKALATASESSNSLLKDNQTYTFVGTFKDAAGATAVQRVTLYTVANSLVDFKPTTLKGGTDLPGVEVDGKFDTPNTKLTGGEVPATNPAKEAMEDKVAKDSLDDDDDSYDLGKVVQIGTNPLKLEDAEGVDIPPFDNGTVVLRLPIDTDYAGEDGYKPGEDIIVLWSGDESGKIVPVTGKVVGTAPDNLKAQITYPYSGDEDGDGIDDTGWAALPGYFAIQYNTNKLPEDKQDAAKAEYFSMRVEVTGNGIVTPSETKYWRVQKSATGAPKVDLAMYALAPLNVGEKAYTLSALTLSRESGNQGTSGKSNFNFMENNGKNEAGELSALKTSLQLTNDESVFTDGSSWVLSARFTEQKFSGGEETGKHKITVKAGTLRNGSFEANDFGAASVYYYNAGQEYVTKPADGFPASSVVVDDIPNNRQATVTFTPKSGVNGTFYTLTEVRVKVGTSGTFQGQALTNPFVLPASASNIEVQAIFTESDIGSLTPARYSVEASVINPEFGSITGANAAGVKTEYYGEDMQVPLLQFVGKESTNYLDYVNVYVGDRVTPIKVNVNFAKENSFDLLLPNYQANLRVEGYFNDTAAPSIELALNVETLDETGQLMSNNNAGGSIVPLDWTVMEMVRSGQKCTMMFSANQGYALEKVELGTGTGQVEDVTAQVKGSVWPFVPVDDRENPTEALKMVITATFKKTSHGPVNPGDDLPERVHMNAYVADEALNNAANTALSYIWGVTADDSFTSDIVTDSGDLTLQEFQNQISVQGQNTNHGAVNGKSSVIDTVAYDGRYPLTFTGATLPDPTNTQKTIRYALDKVLVVSYQFVTDADGNQMKKGLKWELFGTSMPQYVLTNVTSNTDVIAYFKQIDESSEEPVGPGDESMVKVTVNSNVPTAVNYAGDVSVMKGGELLLDIALETTDHVLKTVTVKRGTADEVDVTSAVRAEAAAGASTAQYLLSAVTQDTVVTVTYEQKPEQERTRYMVDANIQVKDTNGNVSSATTMPCLITVGTGDGFMQQSTIMNGANNGVRLLEGSDMRLTLQRDYGYKLQNLSLVWSDESVYAYRATERMEDGTDHNTIHFTKNDADLTGKQPYTSGEKLYAEPTGEDAEGGAPDARAEVWYLYNLVSGVTVSPLYEQQEQQPVDDDSYTVVTKVGRGFGTVMTDSPAFSGNVTKVAKGSVTPTKPLTISFQPAANYRIADVTISSTSGNVFADLWANIMGFIAGKTDEAKMKEEAIKNGYLKMTRVDKDYTITVDFEQIPDVISPDDPQNKQIAMNVIYDSTKGTVTPNTGVSVARDGSQQLTVSPVKVGDAFYSVVGVKVSVGNGTPQEVRAIDKNNPIVTWGEEFYNTFVVNVSALNIPETGTGSDAAVTVEVLFSDTPDTGGESGPGTVSPGTPTADDVKSVVVNVVTDGAAVVGENGLGGVVSPRGSFTLVPQKVSNDGAYEQRVWVSPDRDYEVDTISVVRNGETLGGVADTYIKSVLRDGYFTVAAEPTGTETITVYFKQKPLAERSYTISVGGAGVSGAQGFIKPSEPVTVENTSGQTFTIDPDAGIWVTRIDDAYVDANGSIHALPSDNPGVTWVREVGSTEAINQIHVEPITIGGTVVDRMITVTFQLNSNVDHGIPDSEKADLLVSAFGDGSQYLQFTPSENMMGVLKGSKNNEMAYTYQYALEASAVGAGYGIYRVQVNGEDDFVAAQDGSDVKTEGSFTFTTANMTRDVNTLYVYVGKFDGSGSLIPPDADDPDAWMTVEYGCGAGGTIADKTPGAHQTSSNSNGSSALNTVMSVAKGELFTLLMTPNEGRVLEQVYLSNCRVKEFNWVKPADGRTAKIALEYTLEVVNEDAPARVFATFKPGNANTFKPWDWTYDDNGTPDDPTDDNYNFEGMFNIDGKFVVEITPASGVKALVTMQGDSPKAGDVLHLANPAVPEYGPSVNAKDAEPSTEPSDDDPWGDIFGTSSNEEPTEPDGSYEVTFDTISGKSEPGKVRILVGPLLKWDDDILYTLDSVSGLEDGYTVVERPLNGTATRANYAAEGDEKDGVENEGDGDGSQDGDGTESPVAPARPAFYTYYEVNGTLAADSYGKAASGDADTPTIRIGLRKVSSADGDFPEYGVKVPAGMVQLKAEVTNGEGTIVPTTTTVGTSWYDGNLAGPWIVAEGTVVSFKVEPETGFVLNSLIYNGTDALSNGSFDAETSTLTFRATSSTTVYAAFVTKDSPEAYRTVTISVEGGHGTTSPEPGEYKVEKGTPFPVTFVPDPGYVPYRIWVDDLESFVPASTGGWPLVASWSNQSLKVEFSLAGRTPNTGQQLVQTGQNIAGQIGTGLVKTGDNPMLPVVVLLLLVAGGAAFGGMRLMRASQAAGRAARYSVSDKVTRREESESDDE